MMSEEIPRRFVQATPFQRFTIRLIDGKFVRVPKADLPSTEPARQTAVNNQTEMRELFRLVNGRFTRGLNLDPEDAGCIGKTLPEEAKDAAGPTPMPIAKKKGWRSSKPLADIPRSATLIYPQVHWPTKTQALCHPCSSTP